MKNLLPHLISFLITLLLFIGAIVYYDLYAQSMENTYVHAFAPLLLPQSTNGSAIQRAAFRQSDLLPVYGSSEMLNEASPYRAYNFLAKYPTGFQVFEVAKGGATSLDLAQDLAAIGPDLKGKKVVISFTPTMFNAAEVGSDPYAGDFSDLHANELTFSPYLSLDLKHQAAHRMLDYPNTLEKDPLLSYALQLLNTRSFLNDVIYQLALPLGQLHTEIIRLQDHWQVLTYLSNHPSLNANITRQKTALNWKNLVLTAGTEQKKAVTTNPYGVEDNIWKDKFANFKAKAPGTGDKNYINNLQKSKEWGDLEILIEILNELGAKPLIMSRPINGQLWEAMGVSANARQFYYNTIEKTVAPFAVPLIDFRVFDTDKYFSIDQSSHTSRLGWVYVDQTLDAYFHGVIH